MRRHEYTEEIGAIYLEWLASKIFTLEEEEPGGIPRPVWVKPGSTPKSTYEWVQVPNGKGGCRLALRDEKGLDQTQLFNDALQVSFMWRDVALAHLPPTATEASEIDLPNWLRTLGLRSTICRAATDYYRDKNDRDKNGRIRERSKKVPQSKRMKAVSRLEVEDGHSNNDSDDSTSDTGRSYSQDRMTGSVMTDGSAPTDLQLRKSTSFGSMFTKFTYDYDQEFAPLVVSDTKLEGADDLSYPYPVVGFNFIQPDTVNGASCASSDTQYLSIGFTEAKMLLPEDIFAMSEDELYPVARSTADEHAPNWMSSQKSSDVETEELALLVNMSMFDDEDSRMHG